MLCKKRELPLCGCKDIEKKITMQEQNFSKKIWKYITL